MSLTKIEPPKNVFEQYWSKKQNVIPLSANFTK